MKSPQPTEYSLLLADADRLTAKAMSDLLSRKGFKVYVADSGTEAVALARKDVFNLAILDEELPEISGLLVSGWIRAMPHSKNMPVVISSVWPDGATRAMAVGAAGFLEKPLGCSGLPDRIRQYLDLLPKVGAAQAAAKTGPPFLTAV
jgi:two-component system cell cycle response regulator DivK